MNTACLNKDKCDVLVMYQPELTGQPIKFKHWRRQKCWNRDRMVKMSP